MKKFQLNLCSCATDPHNIQNLKGLHDPCTLYRIEALKDFGNSEILNDCAAQGRVNLSEPTDKEPDRTPSLTSDQDLKLKSKLTQDYRGSQNGLD